MSKESRNVVLFYDTNKQAVSAKSAKSIETVKWCCTIILSLAIKK